MKITVDLPGKLVWEISEQAEKTDRSESQVLLEMLAAPRAVATGGGIVAELWREGLDDGQISVQTGMVRGSVASHRRRLGLPANKPYKRKTGK